MLGIEEVIPAQDPEVLDALIDGSTALTVTDRTEAAMARLEEALRGKSYDLTTTAGDKEARQDRMRLVKLRTSLDRLRKDQNADHKAIIDGNNAFAKAITERIVALEEPIDAAIKADEERRAAEKAERDRIERERILAITAKVQGIKEVPFAMLSANSAQISEAIDKLRDTPIEEGEFAEFTNEAGTAKQVSLLRLGVIRADAFEREETERRQREAREAAEAQRRAAEAQAKAEREEADRKAAAEKAAAQAIADEAARKLAEANAVLAEARRVQEENERREQERLQREAEERAQQEQASAPTLDDVLEAAAPPAIVETLADASAGISLGATMANSIAAAFTPAEVQPEAERPSNAEIIRTVADHFDVDSETALAWIFEIARDELDGALKQAA